MDDTVGAFVPHGLFEVAGADCGPLAGLDFAAKDIIDVAGRVTGCGNPDWLRTHEPAAETATVIRCCLDAGARLVGKTVTEELATGLTGENAHYGTPRNVNAPGRVSGGSSSGSAAAVAAGLVDFALGSDTGGSVRSPASFCGIYGMRPTHGRVSLHGVMPLSKSLDVVGWFAREPDLMASVGEVLLDGEGSTRTPGRLIVADDVLRGVPDDVRAALEAAIGKLTGLLGSSERIEVAGDGAPLKGLDRWAAAARTVWGGEAWAEHREWVEREQPTFGSGVAERFRARAAVTPQELADAKALWGPVADYLADLLEDGAVLALPAAPGVAPLAGGSDTDIEPFRTANEPIGSIAGLGGLPEIVIPMADVDGLPVGLGLAAARGNDELLFDVAIALRDAGGVGDVEVPHG